MIVSCINLLVGVLGVVLGNRIYKDKCVEWIIGYDLKKYDADKLCSIVGRNIMCLGYLYSFYALGHLVLDRYLPHLDLYTPLTMITLAFIICNIQYQSYKHARRNKSNHS